MLKQGAHFLYCGCAVFKVVAKWKFFQNLLTLVRRVGIAAAMQNHHRTQPNNTEKLQNRRVLSPSLLNDLG